MSKTTTNGQPSYAESMADEFEPSFHRYYPDEEDVRSDGADVDPAHSWRLLYSLTERTPTRIAAFAKKIDKRLGTDIRMLRSITKRYALPFHLADQLIREMDNHAAKRVALAAAPIHRMQS